MRKGPPKKCAQKNPSPRQALPLKHNHKHSYLLHLYHHLQHYLHQLFPLQKYYYSLLPDKWILFHLFHPNRNITLKNTTAAIKSFSLDLNQQKGRTLEPSSNPIPLLTQPLKHKQFPAIPSPKRKPDPLAGKKKPSRQEQELSIGQIQLAAALCSVELEAFGDIQLRKALKPLLSLEKTNNLNIANPSNFPSSAMVTTFVRSAGDRTRGVWKFLSTVCQADTAMKNCFQQRLPQRHPQRRNQ